MESSMTYEQFKFEYLMNEKYDDGTQEFADIMNAFADEYKHYYDRMVIELTARQFTQYTL